MPKDKETDEARAESGKISRKEFEKELSKLQVELTRLQTWVKAKGERVIVVFEGRIRRAKAARLAGSPHAPARASTGTWHCPPPPTAKRPKFSSSATSPNSRRRARSSSSTVPGTTGPGLSE